MAAARASGAAVVPSVLDGMDAGGMAAVLGLAEEKVREVLEARGGTVDIANFNLPTQLVLAGPKADVEALVEPLQQTGAERCVVLNVSGAFHSRYMAPVAEEYEAFLRSFSFAPPEIPVLANVDARPYEAGSVAAGLVEQIRSSVRWAETLDFLLGQGVETLEELGPGNVLTKLWATFREAAVAGEAEKAARTLGDEEFRREYGLSYAYVGGASAPGVRGVEFVAALAREGCLAFLDDRRGTEGLAAGVQELRRRLGPQASFGIRLEDDPLRPVEDGGEEARRVEVALSQGVTCVEAAGYHRLTPALVRYRFSRARRDADGTPHAPHRVMALVSRPGAAKLFLEPPPEGIVDDLLAAGQLQAAEA